MQKFAQKVQLYFIQNLPLKELKGLPQNHLYLFGSLTYLLLFVIYVFFFWWGVTTSFNQTFMSLDKSAGICVEVVRPFTAKFLASNDGLWLGDENFKYSKAMYEFTFTNIETNHKDFSKMITNGFDLETIGNYTKTHDLTNNLLVWMHSTKTIAIGGKLQKLSMLSSPSEVFDRRYRFGGVATWNESCLADATSFDIKYARMELNFKNDPDCLRLVANLVAMETQGATVPVVMNLNTLTVCIAINNELLPISALDHIEFLGNYTYQPDISVNATIYFVDTYYYDRDEHSELIYCLTEISMNDTVISHVPQCAVAIGATIVLPFFIPYDASCVGCTAQNRNNSACSSPEFTIAVLYSPLGVDPIFNITRKLHSEHDEIRAALASDILQFDGKFFHQYCPTCRILFAMLFDDNLVISPYFFNLLGGHCNDSINIAPADYEE